MTSLAKIVYLLAISLWIGSVSFFSLVAAPAIFRTLPRHQAGDVVGAIFPAYYWIGHILGALALGCLILLAVTGGLSLRTAAALGILLLMLAANLYAGFALQPQIQKVKAEMRQAPSPAPQQPPSELKAAFDRLHSQSVKLNAVVLAGGLLLLMLSGFGLKL